MASSGRPRILHLTTVDMSLALLLQPQLEAFAEAGYEVIGVSAPGPYVDRLQAAGIGHVALPGSTRSMDLAGDLRAAAGLFRICRRLGPDLVHTHNPKPGIYGRLVARLRRVGSPARRPAVVNTVHGLYAQPSDPLARRAAVYGLERLAAACSDAELVQNPEDLETLAKLGVPRSRLHLLGNGIDLDRFDPSRVAGERAAVRAGWGIAKDEVVVGAVGRLVVEKGYRALLVAAGRLRDRQSPARLVVVGPHEPAKPDALRPGEIDRARQAGVVFAGHREDVERCYAAMDVYVLASHREGWPRSAMEAAAMGLPVIATDIRGCRQVVDHGKTGLLVPVRDPDALGHALARLVDDAQLRERMGGAAREKALAEFDDQRQIDITLRVYGRLLGDGAPGGSVHNSDRNR